MPPCHIGISKYPSPAGAASASRAPPRFFLQGNTLHSTTEYEMNNYMSVIIGIIVVVQILNIIATIDIIHAN